jgi:hypothetical protein
MRFLPFKTEAIRILLTNNNVSCSPIRFDSCTDCVIAQVLWGGVKRSGGIGSLSTCCSVIDSTNLIPFLLGKVIGYVYQSTRNSCVANLQARAMISWFPQNIHAILSRSGNSSNNSRSPS